MDLTNVRLFVSNISKREGLSVEDIEECGKIAAQIDEIEKLIEEKDKKFSDLQGKFADVIMTYPTAKNPENPAAEPVPKTLEEIIEDTIEARNKQNNFIIK